MTKNIKQGDIVSIKNFIKVMADFYDELNSQLNLKKTFDKNISRTSGSIYDSYNDGYWQWRIICGEKKIKGSDVQTLPKSMYKPIGTYVPIYPQDDLIQVYDKDNDIYIIWDNMKKVLQCFYDVKYVISTWKHGQGDAGSTTYKLVTQEKGFASVKAGQRIISVDFPESIVSGDVISADAIYNIIEYAVENWKTEVKNHKFPYEVCTCHYVCHSNYNNRVRR